jgi:hypothetical protein
MEPEDRPYRCLRPTISATLLGAHAFVDGHETAYEVGSDVDEALRYLQEMVDDLDMLPPNQDNEILVEKSRMSWPLLSF